MLQYFNMVLSLIDALFHRRKKPESPRATQQPLSEVEVETQASDVIRNLMDGSYCHIIGLPDRTKQITDRIASKLSSLESSPMVIRINLHENSSMKEIIDIFLSFGFVPEGNYISVSDIFNFLLSKDTNKKIVVILENLQNLQQKDRTFIRGIRSLNQEGALHPKFRRLTFLLTAVEHPSDLLPHDRATPYNIGSTFRV